MPPAIPSEIKPEIDSILEAIVYLYTESRRLTKELARQVDLTGPQLTVLKMLEGVGDLSLSELSERIRAQNSTVTGIIDRMEREGLVVRDAVDRGPASGQDQAHRQGVEDRARDRGRADGDLPRRARAACRRCETQDLLQDPDQDRQARAELREA